MEESFHESVIPNVFDLPFDWFLELDWDGMSPLGDRHYILLHLNEVEFQAIQFAGVLFVSSLLM